MITDYQKFCKQGILQPTLMNNKALIFGLGLTGEAGEVADIIKKHYGHGKPLDKEHLTEELGDVMWYVANLCNTFEIPLKDVLNMNIQKLKKRYPEMYDQPKRDEEDYEFPWITRE